MWSFTNSDLSDTDNIVPFENTTSVNLINLLCAGILTILVKTIVNTNNNTLAKSIADTNTNTAFEKYCQYQYQYFCDNTFYRFYIQQHSFFRGHLLVKLIK